MTDLGARMRRNGSIYFPRTLGGIEDLWFYTQAQKNFQHVLLAGPPGSGKCLAEGSYTFDAQRGRKIAVTELKPHQTLHSVALDSYRIQTAQVKIVADNGVQECIRVVTESGRYNDVTFNHPFLTRVSWVMALELTVGAQIAVPTYIPEPITPIAVSHEILVSIAKAINDSEQVPDDAFCLSQADARALCSMITRDTFSTFEAARDVADLFLKARQRMKIEQQGSAVTLTPIVDDNPLMPDIVFERIVSVESIGERQTHSVEVTGWHNHIFGGILSHNTAGLEAAFDSVAEEDGPMDADAPPGLYTLIGSDSTIVDDFVGSYVQDPHTGNFVWVDGPLVRSIKEDVPFLIDEVALIEPRVLSVVYPLMDGRGVLEVTQNPSLPPFHIGKNWFVVAAYNPDVPGAHISEALLDRFQHRIEVETDWSLAKSMGVPVTIVDIAENLNLLRRNGDISWSPQFRSLLAFRDNARLYGQSFAIQNLISKTPEDDRHALQDLLKSVKLGGQGSLSPLTLGGRYEVEDGSWS